MSAIIFRGLSREGVQNLRKTQMRKRLRLADADLPINIQNAPEVVLVAAGDTAITDIEPPIDSVANPRIVSRVTTGASSSVLVALGRYQFFRPCGEAPAPDGPVSPTSEYIIWASAEPDRVYVSNRCGSTPDETARGAPLNSRIDAWRYLKHGDPGYDYDRIANFCARPDIRLRPGRIYCNAELRGALGGAKLDGESKGARIRAQVR